LNFEQLLFLEIFELFYKFGSNLGFKANGNLVNTMNSVHRLSYIAGGPSLVFQVRRGRLWHRAGVGTAPAWLLFASWSVFIARASPSFFSSLPLFSSVATVHLR